MLVQALVCPKCGAPLPADATFRVTVCAFCKYALTLDASVVPSEGFRRALAALDDEVEPSGGDVTIAGLRYRLAGRLAQGHSSDVFFAERARRIGERVVVKVLRAATDGDLLEREWAALSALRASTAQGAPHFIGRLPQLVVRGTVAESGAPATVQRFRSGFVHTLADVAAAFAGGLDPRHAVWLWRRTLELLGFVHRSGYAHGAILPEHVLVHAKDHGVALVGWSCAARLDSNEPLPVRSTARRALYPAELWSGAAPSAASDLAMSARCIVQALGGDAETGALPGSVPATLAELLRAQVKPGPASHSDAWTLSEAASDAARTAFGPPSFVPLHLPGRS